MITITVVTNIITNNNNIFTTIHLKTIKVQPKQEHNNSQYITYPLQNHSPMVSHNRTYTKIIQMCPNSHRNSTNAL